LRYQPVVAFGGLRLVRKTIELGGYSIPEGCTLVQCLSETNRGDAFPHPHRFDPDNFLSRKVRNNDWMPFGGGSRICTGMGLAQLEIAVVVATIVQRVDLELGSGSTAPRLSGIDYEPANGLRVRVLGRRGAG
jgi:cytochrome P450